MIDACIRATLLLSLAFACAAVLRHSSAAARHLVWASTLSGLLALPLISLVAPSLRITVPALVLPGIGQVVTASLPADPVDATGTNTRQATVVPSRPVTSRTNHAVTLSDAAGARGTGNERRAAAAGAEAEAANPMALLHEATMLWRLPLLLWWVIWALGAAAIVARLALGLSRMSLIVRRATIVTQPEWSGLLDRVSHRLGLYRRIELRMGPAGESPVTCGVLHPVVILPADAESWDDERRTLVLTHELAHVRRFDILTHLIGQLAVAVFWFHPLAWLAASRMCVERERACDDLVLAAGARPSHYARDLLTLVHTLHGSAAPAVAALGIARRTEIEGRLVAILDGAVRREPIGPRRVAVAAGLFEELDVMGIFHLRPSGGCTPHNGEATCCGHA